MDLRYNKQDMLVQNVSFDISTILTTDFEGKRHGIQPQNGIPGFSLHFPKELSYGYLRFEGNGKISLGR